MANWVEQITFWLNESPSLCVCFGLGSSRVMNFRVGSDLVGSVFFLLMTLCFFSGDGNFSGDIINMRLYCLCMNESFKDSLWEDCVETHDTWSPRNMVIIIDDLTLLPQIEKNTKSSKTSWGCHWNLEMFQYSIIQILTNRKEIQWCFIWVCHGVPQH